MVEPTDGDEARQAVQDANGHLARTQEQWPTVRNVSASLRDAREVNHFAAKMAELYRS